MKEGEKNAKRKLGSIKGKDWINLQKEWGRCGPI